MTTHDLDLFLNKVLPDALRAAQTAFSLVVVGTRAIHAYACAMDVTLNDWDVAVIGDQSAMESFAASMTRLLVGYNINIATMPGKGPQDDYSFRSRAWIRMTMGDVTILDIFQVSDRSPLAQGPFVIKKKLLYVDLGFLMRELNRREENAKQLIAKALKVSVADAQKYLSKIQNVLEGVSVDLYQLDDEVGIVEETLDRSDAQQIRAELDASSKKLRSAVEGRDILFGVVLTGNTNKILTDQVAKMCRDMENQYQGYLGLKQRCQQVLLVAK